MATQLAMDWEKRQMPQNGPRDAVNARKSDRKAYDTLVPYRSGFARDSWALRHGSARCVCRACGDGFNSVTAFDKHQVLNSRGQVVCRDPATLGMVRNADGWWITEAREVRA